MAIHETVLLEEAIGYLELEEGMTVIDATLGAGGHSRKILEKIGKSGRLIAIDADIQALKNFENSEDKRVSLVNGNFSHVKKVIEDEGIGPVDAIIADLGWSSDQMNDLRKGMSFKKEAKLDMRLDGAQELSAETVVNAYSQSDLERIIKEYGEERFFRRIAKEIVENRKKKKIETTTELAEIIRKAIPARYRHGKIDPATRTFQAIRIEVNSELENLKKFVPDAIEALRPGGRIAIISFHSLEDRIVKNMLRENAGGCICPKDLPQCVCNQTEKVKIITRKPVIPSDEEVALNPRSRSAKLRVGEKI